MKFELFFSYASEDKDELSISTIAQYLENYSENHKFNVKYFERDSVNDFEEYMLKEVKKCDYFVIFVSDISLHKPYIKEELNYAFRFEKPIIPICKQFSELPNSINNRVGALIRHKEDGTVNTQHISEEIFRIIVKNHENLDSEEKTSLLTKKGENYRISHSERLRNKLNSLSEEFKTILKAKSPKIDFDIANLTKSGDPEFDLSEGCLTSLCSVLTKSSKVKVIIPSIEKNEDSIDSFSRISLLLKLLNISVNYSRLIGVSVSDDIAKKIEIDFKSDPDHLLICSDYAFLKSNNGRLVVSPAIGESINFLWVMARDMFKHSELNYISGSHRHKSVYRERMINIFKGIDVEKEFFKYYSSLDRNYDIQQIFIIKNRKSSRNRPEIREIQDIQNKYNEIQKALMISPKYTALFWDFNDETYSKRVTSILNDLDLRDLKVYEIYVSSIGNPYTRQEDLKMVKNFINFPDSVHPPETSTFTCKIGRNINYHNGQLLDSLSQVRKIRMFTTLDMELFSETIFWEYLEKNERLKFELLLIEPSSRSYKLYLKKEKGYSDSQINEKIENLKNEIQNLTRLQESLSCKNISNNLQIRFTSQVPMFRMTFIGDERLLLGPLYNENERDYRVEFFDMERNLENSMYECAEKKFKLMWKDSSAHQKQNL